MTVSNSMPKSKGVYAVENGFGWNPGFKRRAGLTEESVLVIRAEIDLAPPVIAENYKNLSNSERERAARFKFDLHRNRYVACHGILRNILGILLDEKPSRLEFSRGERGKPALAGRHVSLGVEFNMAHSEKLVAFAIGKSRRLGIDIEYIESRTADEEVAATHFSERELADLKKLSGEEWKRGFFNCWTRKEAFIKATGEGLYRPLDSFDVTLIPGQPAEILSIDSDSDRALGWKTVELSFGEGYAGALTAEGRQWVPSLWEWEG